MMNYSKRQGKGEKRGSPPTDYVLKPRDREIQCSAGFLDGIQIESTERKSGKKGGSFIYRLETDGKKSTQPKGGGWNDERRGENNNKDKFFLYSLLPRGDRK
jgi:hypothetical protein